MQERARMYSEIREQQREAREAERERVKAEREAERLRKQEEREQEKAVCGSVAQHSGTVFCARIVGCVDT